MEPLNQPTLSKEENDFIQELGLDGRAAAEQDAIGHDSAEESPRGFLEAPSDQPPHVVEATLAPEGVDPEEWQAEQLLRAADAPEEVEGTEDPDLLQRLAYAEGQLAATQPALEEVPVEQGPQIADYNSPAIAEALAEGLDLDDEGRRNLASKFNAAMEVERSNIAAPLQSQIDALVEGQQQNEARSQQERNQATVRSNVAVALQHTEANGTPMEKVIARDLLTNGQNSRLFRALDTVPGLGDSAEGVWMGITSLARDIESTQQSTPPVSESATDSLPVGNSVTAALPTATIPSTTPTAELTYEQKLLQNIFDVPYGNPLDRM